MSPLRASDSDQLHELPADHDADTAGEGPRYSAVKRAALAVATAFVSVNIWTGAPLLALWIGSQFAGQTSLNMKAALLVIVTLATMVFTMAVLLTWLNNTYEEMVRRSQGKRRSPWMRSMSSETDDRARNAAGVTLLERILIISVYVAVIALLLWFLFIAGSPLPQ